MSALRVATKLSLAALAAAGVALTLRADLRHALVAQINDPAGLPALDTDPRVHFETAARACARQVAALLPQAIADIEAAHGRAFAQPPRVGVYADFDAYARANGLGDPTIAGVSRAGAALLSPSLCVGENYRLRGVLTHELSHVHFFGWRARHAPRPPQWFAEGLAVFASNGGAAEGVGDAEATQAIRDGYAATLDERPWSDFAAIGFAREPPPNPALGVIAGRQRLAFRQAALFVGWLRARDAAAFARLLRALESGAPFAPAFAAQFAAAPDALWRDFLLSLDKETAR